MKLNELISQIKDQSLSKEQLELYSDQLAHLFNDIQNEMAHLEKEEAMFMGKEIEKSVAQRKIEWKMTLSGQRLIALKRYSLGCSKIISSVKSRVFRLIY